MGLALITAATTYPVTLAEAKAQCRVDSNDEDSTINSLIATASGHVESLTGKAIITQTWELTLDEFEDEIFLERGPVASVTSVKYYDTDGVQQTLTTEYEVDLTSEPARVVLADGASWPAVEPGINRVAIRYVAGAATADPEFKQACLLLIGQWFEERADATDKPYTSMPNGVKSLLYSKQAMVI